MSMMLRRLMTVSNGSAVPAGCEIGIFTPDSDLNTVTVSHSLGVVPRTAAVIGNLNGEAGSDNKAMIMMEFLGSDMTGRVFDNSYTTTQCPRAIYQSNSTSGTEYQTTTTYTTYPAAMTSTEVTFATGRYYSGKFAAGKSYIYVITK